MRDRLIDRQPSFDGGVNLAVDDLSLAPNQVRRAENARLSSDGWALKRRGTRRTAAPLASAPVRGGVSWQRPGAVQELALVNGTLYTATLGLPTTWAARTGAFVATAVPSFAPFRDASADVVYIADGGPLNKWTGAAVVTDLASTPPVSGVVVYNQRLIGWGDATNPEQLYWSGFGNGDTLGQAGAGGGAALVQTFGDREIVACGVVGGTLLILHASGISTFTGVTTDDIAIGSGTSGLTADYGCAAARSVVPIGSALLFLSDRGFVAATPGGVERISSPIDPILRGVDRSEWGRVWGVHCRERREVWWSLPGVGLIVYHYESNAWSGPWTGIFRSVDTHALWETVDAQGRPVVLRGRDDGIVEWCDRGGGASAVLDDEAPNGGSGQRIAMTLQCHRFTHGDPTQLVSARHATIVGDFKGSTEASVRTAIGRTTTATALSPQDTWIWGQNTWGSAAWGTAGVVPQRIPAQGTGPWADLTIIDSSDREVLVSSVDLVAFRLGSRQYA